MDHTWGSLRERFAFKSNVVVVGDIIGFIDSFILLEILYVGIFFVVLRMVLLFKFQKKRLVMIQYTKLLLLGLLSWSLFLFD